MKNDAKYTYQTMWILVAIWTIISVWTWYIAYEHLHWNGNLWFALGVTYFVALLPIVAFSDVEVVK